MTIMETLSQAINRLQNEGYNSEITPDEINVLNPKDWGIDKICRFEGKSNPDDSSILYAVSKKDGSRKSLVVNSYGIYSESEINSFIEKVSKSK
ncbi:hypothetical protein BH10BAC1_BH10BAC1_00440 [soil metagenome]